jgi:RNA polymerase sigma-70 factor (ECF subfamily)
MLASQGSNRICRSLALESRGMGRRAGVTIGRTLIRGHSTPWPRQPSTLHSLRAGPEILRFSESHAVTTSSKSNREAEIGSNVLCATLMTDTANREPVHSLAKANALSAPNPHRLPSTVARDDEPLLVAAAKSGDASAFEELVNRYERKIFRLTMNITRNREDAEDAMQDAFMKAYAHLNGFQEDSRFYTWLVRIAANEALMRLRKRRPNQFSLDEPIESDDDLMPREIEDWGPSPEQRYAQSEMQEILNKVIDQLEPDFRVVFVLRDIEEFSTEETADAVGISVPAVKSRLLRARLKLRQKLDRYLRHGELN